MKETKSRKEESRLYYQRNKEAIKARVKAYREANREKVLAKKREYSKKVQKEDWWRDKWSEKRRRQAITWRNKNPDKVKAYNKKYKKENSELCSKIARRRISSQRGQTPKWLTSDQKIQLQEFSQLTKALNKQAGRRAFTVDHIIPLNGENVCGLHVPWNLQILSIEDNASKSNKCDGTHENESWRKDRV